MASRLELISLRVLLFLVNLPFISAAPSCGSTHLTYIDGWFGGKRFCCGTSYAQRPYDT
ncbi:hypothetical protein K443DRAFT_676173 [Laccaria amethystina LaAM-08-1]|uniref:Cellulase n=1 Tax=Laccaria amethystina LaAM-08-1 TaxID=1095629 RepID=A0A0C9Y2A4_9AGAR|nr:hypothetical protein K443DRAFT_676173 [Laccaria amethystina LaAM-08-1]